MIDNETLVKRIQQGENVNDNMMQLYNQNMGLLYKATKHYIGYDGIIDKDDLMQEAYIYLYDAVSHYEADKGVKFATYLTNNIKWNIGRDMRNKRVVKLPEKLSYDISKYMGFLEEYTKEHDKQPTDKEAMERLGISESRLKTVKNAVNMVSMASIDKSISEDTTIAEMLKDDKDDIQEIEDGIDKDIQKVELWKIVESALTDEQMKLLKLRFIDGLTLQQCSEQFGVSQQRIDQKCRSIKCKLTENYKTRRDIRKYM